MQYKKTKMKILFVLRDEDGDSEEVGISVSYRCIGISTLTNEKF